MRVVLVTHGFPPAGVGGAELYAHAHARALAAAGDKVLVLAREADPARAEFAVRRERRHSIEIAWINNTFARVRSFVDTYADDRIDATAAFVIDEFRPEVAHVHHLTCLSTGIVHELASRQIPVFCTLHDYWLLCHRGQLLDRDLKICVDPAACTNCLGPEAAAGRLAFAGRAALMPVARHAPVRLLAPLRTAVRSLTARSNGAGTRDSAAARRDHMRGVMAGITHFFAPSRFIRDRFVAAGIDPARITVSEYGWSLPGAQEHDRRAMASSPNSPLQIGFIGSLMVSKAPHILLEAVAGLPAGSCVVNVFGGQTAYHGDDSYRARITPLLSGRNVRYHGVLEREHLRSALEQMDVLAVPSTWPENSPLVIREAFLAGVPVIASRTGGIPETVSDEVDGLLFEPGSVPALRDALRRLIEQPQLLERLRSGIPPVRTIEDDVDSMRRRYEVALAEERTGRTLAAVVLNYGTPDDTFLAVRSLLLSHRSLDHVIVIDNTANDDCRSALSRLSDQRIEFHSTGRNLGFSGGMNAGIELALDAGADAVLLVNSDVIVPVDAVGALEQALYSKPGAGIAGPVVLGRSTPDRIASHGIAYNSVTGRMRHRSVGEAAVQSRLTSTTEVEAVSGCAMLVKREVFEAAGMFDPACFFSFEDIEFCLRAKDAGFSSIVAARATALHEGGRSIGKSTPKRLYFAARNHLWLTRRRGGPGRRAGAAARAGFVIVLNLAHALKAPGGSAATRLVAACRGTRDYFLQRFGPGAAD